MGGMAELYRLAGCKEEFRKHPKVYSLDLLCGALVISAPYFPWLLLPAILYLPIRLVSEIYAGNVEPAKEIGRSFLAIGYVALPIAALAFMRHTLCHGFSLVLATFILIWISDTGAFCVGSLIGRHPFFPRISPKKSWEGFFGGVFLCVAGGLIFILCFRNEYIPNSLMVMLSLLVPVAAAMGDLVESMLKRASGVKDSGNIMPGHGGFLDRIDSLLVVSPVVSVLYLLYSMVY